MTTFGMLVQVVVLEPAEGVALDNQMLRFPDVFDLVSINGPTFQDQRLSWAAEIIAIIPLRNAWRIILRGGERAD